MVDRDACWRLHKVAHCRHYVQARLPHCACAEGSPFTADRLAQHNNSSTACRTANSHIWLPAPPRSAAALSHRCHHRHSRSCCRWHRPVGFRHSHRLVTCCCLCCVVCSAARAGSEQRVSETWLQACLHLRSILRLWDITKHADSGTAESHEQSDHGCTQSTLQAREDRTITIKDR
jgi:hypothetical protein